MNQCERGDETCKSPSRRSHPAGRIARRVGAAGLALATVLTLGACKATGGGYIDDPLPGGVLPVGDIDGTYTGTCKLRLQLHLRDERPTRRP